MGLSTIINRKLINNYLHLQIKYKIVEEFKMSNMPKNLTETKAYFDSLESLGFIRSYYCEAEESENYNSMGTLPENVFIEPSGGFSSSWRIHKYLEPDLSSEKIQLLLSAQNAINIKKIKNYALFFVILSVIGLIVSIFS